MMLKADDMDIKGGILGITLTNRGKDDNHVMVNIYVEDDEVYHHEISFSSAWLDSVIDTLLTARKALNQKRGRFRKDKLGGYKG